MIVSQPAADEIKAAALKAIKDVTQTSVETIENTAKNVMASSLINLDSQLQQGISSIADKGKICEQTVDTKTNQAVALMDDKARRCEQEVEMKKQNAVAAIETKTMAFFQELQTAADGEKQIITNFIIYQQYHYYTYILILDLSKTGFKRLSSFFRFVNFAFIS